MSYDRGVKSCYWDSQTKAMVLSFKDAESRASWVNRNGDSSCIELTTNPEEWKFLAQGWILILRVAPDKP